MNQEMFVLKEKLQQILEFIVDKNDVLYLDFPMYLNVGDLLIYAGTEQFFKDYGINVKLRRTISTFDINEVFDCITPKTTILCQGGGNFGDLYPELHSLREKLIQSFPNNRIIILPQTAYFSSENALQNSANIFLKHKDCYIFARDERSKQLMENFSDKVFLSPDMAHQLYGCLQQSTYGKKKQLYFLRKDKEVSQFEKNVIKSLANDAVIKDWDDITTLNDRIIIGICYRLARIANKLKSNILKNIINKIWEYQTLKIIDRSLKYFLSFDKVITSRLHGHIFSCLLDIPSEVCDNSYGKNLAYYYLWTQKTGLAKKYEN